MDESKNHAEVKTDEFLMKLNEYAESIAKRLGYVNYVIEKNKISADGGSYLGILYEINIKGNTGNCEQETNVFVKNSFESDVPMTISMSEVYNREYFVYSDLAKQLDELQDERLVPDNDRYKISKAFDECSAQTIIIENLTTKGFKTWPRMDAITLKYAELVIKNLAKLHGLSFALKKYRPDYFEANIKDLQTAYIDNEFWNGFMENMKSFSYTFLNDDKKKEVYFSNICNIVDKYHSYLRDDSCIKTICHGDYRHNNVMFREINGKPADVIAVDYQLIYYGNPVLDFIYFIFWGTDQDFRKKHLTYLKNLYHDHLQTFLEYFNIDVEDVFPKAYFEEQYKNKLDFGVMIAAFCLPFLFPSENNLVDVFDAEGSLDKVTIKVDERFGERFRGIIEDFIQWGYL